TITDFNGCISSASVTIDENPGVSAVINSSTDVSCFGGNDGGASVSPAGGTGGTYAYSWNIVGGVAVGTTPTAAANSMLIANNYYVNVTDSNGCVVSDTVTITEPPLLVITAFNVDSVTCNGLSNGVVDVTFTGGTLGYTHVWTPSISSGATAAGLPAGTYNVEVTDSKGCIKDSTYTVFEPAQLVIDTATVPSNCGNSDGEATVSIITGSTPGYTYAWNSPSSPTTANVTGLAASTYVVTVTDNNNCSVSQNVVVYTVPGPVIDSIIVTNITCFGDNNGTATVYSSGGITPLTYQWDDAALQATQTASNLAGSPPLYTVTVKNGNNCTVTGVTQITEPNVLIANINAPNTACFGEVIQLFATGNGGTHFTAPNDSYNIVWTTLGNVTGQGPILDSMTATITHIIGITDANGCTAQQNQTIVVSPELIVTPDALPICEGDIATLIAGISGGNALTVSYTWEVIDSTTLVTTAEGIGNPLNVTPIVTTDYIVTAYDGCSLPAVGGVKLTVNPLADVQLVSDTFSGCPTLIVDLKAMPIGGGTGVSFQWDVNGDGVYDISSANDSINYAYTIGGIYDVSVITTTAEACVDTITSVSHVTVYQNPVADFATDPSPAVVNLLNSAVEFSDLSAPNSSSLISFNWNFGDGSNGIEINPIHNYLDTGFYNVMLTVENFEGCIDSITKTIRVKPEFLFIMPNSFTPDGDGLNDVFKPGTMIGVDERDYGFYIFDRWGELLHEGHDLSDGWDSFFKAKQVPSGVYIWKIDVTDLEGVVHKLNGNVNVLR
ncbi:MAG: gliding motility-associated C-terminal domain-containing protein, partial [Vicingaceae bacterium]